MTSHDGRFTIVFNGEIYNYLELRDELRAHGAVLRTQSDTEVILEAWRAWGAECLAKFRGMFAFALHDRTDGSCGSRPRSVRQEAGLLCHGSAGPG